MMATGGSEMVKGLKDEVTCPLCLDIFTDPKRLPCEHVYCKECLRGLALRSRTGTDITCPECRRDTPVPNNGVAAFSTPHQVNRLIEMYQKSVKTESAKTDEADGASTAQPSCKVHHSQPLALYCETCQSLTCRDCVLKTCAKKNHSYDYIDDMALKQQRGLEKKMKPIEQLCQKMSSSLETISAAQEKTERKKQEKLERIKTRFDSLHEIVEQERQRQTECIEKSYQSQKILNSTKKEEVSEALEELKSIVDSIKSSPDSKSDFLSGIESLNQSIRGAITKFKDFTLLPNTVPQMEVELAEPVELEEFLQTQNFAYLEGDSLKAHLTSSVDFSKIPLLETSEVILNLNPAKKSKFNVVAHLHCSHQSFTQPVSVKRVSDEKYILSISPKNRGHHELHITCNDTPICGSPLPVFVTIHPQQISSLQPKVTTVNGVAGIKYYKGKLFLSDLGNAILIFDSSTMCEQRRISMPGVNEILVDSAFLYATDLDQYRVVKMSMDGTIVKSTGRKGSAAGEFDCPNGIRLSKDGEIYVCDGNNHRVQVFDRDLNFLG